MENIPVFFTYGKAAYIVRSSPATPTGYKMIKKLYLEKEKSENYFYRIITGLYNSFATTVFKLKNSPSYILKLTSHKRLIFSTLIIYLVI